MAACIACPRSERVAYGVRHGKPCNAVSAGDRRRVSRCGRSGHRARSSSAHQVHQRAADAPRNPASGVPSRITERPSAVSAAAVPSSATGRRRSSRGGVDLAESVIPTSPRRIEAWPARSRETIPAHDATDPSDRRLARLLSTPMPFATILRAGRLRRPRRSSGLFTFRAAWLGESRRDSCKKNVGLSVPGGATRDAPGAPGAYRALAARIARGSLRARPILPRRFRPRRCAGGRQKTPHGGRPPQNEDDSAARPTAVARLTASLGASTSTRRDIHVGRRAARRQLVAAPGRQARARARPTRLRSARRWTPRCRADTPWRKASRARATRRIRAPTSATGRVLASPPPTSPRKSSATRRRGGGTSTARVVVILRTCRRHGEVLPRVLRRRVTNRGGRAAHDEARRERLSACAESVSDLSSRLSKRLLRDEWSAAIGA